MQSFITSYKFIIVQKCINVIAVTDVFLFDFTENKKFDAEFFQIDIELL